MLIISLITGANVFVKDVHWELSGVNLIWSLIFLLPAFYFILSINNLYEINIILTRSAHAMAVIKSLFYFLPLIILLNVMFLHLNFLSLALLVLSFILAFIAVFYVFRVEMLRRFYLMLKKTGFKKNVLIVGDGSSGKILATKLAFENTFGIKIIGFIDDNKNLGEEIIKGKKVLGNVSELNKVVKDYQVDEIIIADDTSEYEQLLNLLDVCKKTKARVKFTSNLFKIIPEKIFTEKYADIPVVNVSPSADRSLMIKTKYIFDRVVSFIGLIIISPGLILIAILVKLSSRGPVLYKQVRIGKDGKPFMFFKFRTMKSIENDNDAERKEMMINFMKGIESNGDNNKVINSDRVTGIGKILRKSSLDELPQLFNVLKGDMSLVGPRPCLPYEYEYLDCWQKRRFRVLPGCTGMWQVAGRSKVTFNDSIVMDLYYINNLSPWLDLQLLIKTIPVMLFGRGGD
ncbi:MAG TPA: sugar transferase [Ignavibacteriaceae bacterium]|nr:sugar transferase [Ignavibacteriaceae bacterium]